MGEAAAEAAGAGIGERLAVSAALEVLRAKWGGHYAIGHDAERGWWASRHGVTEHMITADDPGELDRLVAEEHGPVVR